MKFTDAVLNEIKTHNRVPDVVSAIFPDRLQDKGISGYVGRVPWREDRQPSFSLKQISSGVWVWQDWADADAKGDVIELVKRIRQVDFVEAVQWLANELGVSISMEESKNYRQSLSTPEDRLQALQCLYEAAHSLDDNTAAATYLEKRGLLATARILEVRCFAGGEPAKLIGNGGRYGLYAVESWIKRGFPFLVYGGLVGGKWTAYRFRLFMSQKQAEIKDLKAAHCSPVTEGLMLPTTWPPLPDSLPSEVLLTEGESDALAVRTLVSDAQVFAILGTSGMGERTEAFRKVAKARPKVTLAFQRDAASSKAAKKLIETFSKHQVECRALVPAGGAKDWGELVEWDAGRVENIDIIAAPLDDFGVPRLFDALTRRVDDLASGRIKAIPLPWNNLAWSFGGVGIPPGTVGILTARTNVGKTWKSFHLVLHVLKLGIPCFILNTEMPEAAIAARLLAIMAGDSKVINPNNADLVREYQFDYQRKIDRLPLQITSPDLRTVSDVVELITKAAERHRLIVLDHLGDLNWQGRPPYMVLPPLVKDLQKIAQRKNCVIMLVSHMKQAEHGGDVLSYSKIMENCVDWSWSLQAFKPKAVTVSTAFGRCEIDINRSVIVRKNRYGRSDIEIAFNFDEETLTLSDEGIIVSKAGTAQKR